MRSKFGEMLREARRLGRFTLRDVSGFVGLQPSYLSEVENGTRPAPKDQDKLKQLSKILRLDFEALVAAANIDQLAGSKDLFKKLLNSNMDLAQGFCRAVEDCTEDQLSKALGAFMEALENRKQEAHE